MKKLLVAAACLSPLFSTAKLQLSANVGAAFHAVKMPSIANSASAEKELPSSFVELRARMKTKGIFEYGLGVQLFSIKTDADYTPVNAPQGFTIKYRAVYANPATALCASLGVSFKAGKHQIAAGGKIGGVYTAAEGMPTAATAYAGNGFGVAAGLYADYAYYFGRIGVGASVSPTYFVVDAESSPKFSTLSVPVSVGVHLKL